MLASPAAAGPPLRISDAQLTEAMNCTGRLSDARADPVLLTPAFSTAAESYGWNYFNALPAAGRPTCSLTLPDRGFGDLQRAAEYVVGAVRRMRRASGREVVLLAHQHGALDGLWALRFWPGLRKRVSEFVALATPFNGTTTSAGACRPGGRCPPAVWQITKGSRFLAALGRGKLPNGVAYTSVTTVYDELITPQPAASRLHGASNVVIQDICPGRPVEHFTILGDAAAYRVVLDALRNRGPADPRRIPASACSELLMPGVDATALTSAVGFLSRFGLELTLGGVPAEPPTRRYAR